MVSRPDLAFSRATSSPADHSTTRTDFQGFRCPRASAVCPASPAMIAASSRWRSSGSTADNYIQRHIRRRSAKASGTTSIRSDPLRHATKCAPLLPVEAQAPLASLTRNARGQLARPPRDMTEGVSRFAHAARPVHRRLCFLLTNSLAAPARPLPLARLPEQAYPRPPMTTRAAILRLKWQAAKRLAPARR